MNFKIGGTAGTAKMELGGSAEVRFIEGADHVNELETRAGFLQNLAEVIKTADYTVLTTDKGVPLVANKATAITFGLPAVASSSNEATSSATSAPGR